MKLSLGEISKIIGASLDGNISDEITGINTLDEATSDHISYATDSKYIKAISNSSAGAIIVNSNLKKYCTSSALIVTNPNLAFAKLSHYFKKYQTPIDSKEIQLNTSNLRSIEGVSVGDKCFIGRGVIIAKNTIIESNCIIEDGACIGENSRISANVVIGTNCQVGKNCIISPGAIIGSEGFGNARTNDMKWYPIAHLGNVTIGDNVSIGANTTIDRGTIKDTEIHNGVKIDNLVHIAHNVIIGENTAIAAKTGIAGTTTIGKRCMIGGMVGVVGHLSITDDVIINATSTVNRNILKPGVYTGFVPIMLHSEWKKVGLWLTKLDKIATLLKIKIKNIK